MLSGGQEYLTLHIRATLEYLTWGGGDGNGEEVMGMGRYNQSFGDKEANT